MGTNKLKIIKDYDKMSDELLEQLKLEYPNGFSNHLRSICFTGDIGTSFVHGLHLSSKDFASHEPIFNPTNTFCIEDDFFSKLKPFEPKNLCDENEEKPKIMVKENKNYK